MDYGSHIINIVCGSRKTIMEKIIEMNSLEHGMYLGQKTEMT